MTFRVSPLDSQAFEHLYGRSDEELLSLGARRMVVTVKPGFPCRLTLADAEVGESVLLVHFEHQPGNSPYRASHAVFVREHATSVAPFDGALPEAIALRLLSVRAFDDADLMIDADVVKGSNAEPVIARMLDNADVAYLHLHNAKPGCYAARVDRLA